MANNPFSKHPKASLAVGFGLVAGLATAAVAYEYKIVKEVSEVMDQMKKKTKGGIENILGGRAPE